MISHNKKDIYLQWSRICPFSFFWRKRQGDSTGGGSLCIVPVSYTHLDVYKRQAENYSKNHYKAKKYFQNVVKLVLSISISKEFKLKDRNVEVNI